MYSCNGNGIGYLLGSFYETRNFFLVILVTCGVAKTEVLTNVPYTCIVF